MKRRIDTKIQALAGSLNAIEGISSKWSCSGHPGMLGVLSETPYISFHSSAEQGQRLAQIIADTPGLNYHWYIAVSFSSYLHLTYTIRLKDETSHIDLTFKIRAKEVWQDLEKMAESIRHQM